MFVNVPHVLSKQPLVSCVGKSFRSTRETRQGGQFATKKKSGIAFSEILDNEMAKGLPRLRPCT